MQKSKMKTACFAGGFAVLMLLFTFVDLSLSKALFNQSNWFGNLFAGIAELPGTLLATFSCAALIVTRPRTNKVISVISIVGFGLLMVLAALMAGVMPLGYLPLPQWFMVTGLIYALAALVISLKISKQQAAALRRAAALGLILMLLAMVLINIIKVFWGRPRMRSMTDPDSQFVMWFIPQGFTILEEFKSFPSGHSANAACILWITLLPTFLPSLRTKKVWVAVNAIAYTWIGLTMLSRIIMGAHFGSDVTMGAGITVFCFYMMKRLFYKNHPELLCIEQAKIL